MNYWKLRALITQCQLLEEKAKKLISEANSIKSIAFKEAELDINKNYNLNDDKESIEEVKV